MTEELNSLTEIEGLAEELVNRRQCTATSKRSHERCKRSAILGGSVCFMHGGGAPQVQKRARERLLELVEPALAGLTRLVLNPKTADQVKLAAIKDILDRAGLGASIKLDHDVHIFDTREEIQRRAEEIVRNANERAAQQSDG